MEGDNTADDGPQSTGFDAEYDSDGTPVEDALPREQHLVFSENQRGVSFDMPFAPYLKGASRITVTDPYIRLFYQVRNLMELIETIVRHKSDADEVKVHLITVEDDFKGLQQREYLERVAEGCLLAGINFTWEFDDTCTLHARHIITDNGWKILLDRGLDIFQHYEMNDAFALTNRIQHLRACKAFEVTFIKNG